ncbi:MAG: hypothetical protein AB8B97_04480 [Granulosicoccus sp.]
MINFRSHGRPIVPCLVLSFATVLVSQTVSADVRTTADYIAIDVEAEDFDASAIDGHDARWILTDPTTAQTEQDPDGNNSDGAVGNKYLELLPDVRVRHEDPFGPPTAYWGQRGTGPILQYPIDFPEAGRYYVHARANSSGTEDNGIHVGLNGEWPMSGFRMQWCTGGMGWQWSSRARASGGAGDCGVNFTIWLDVEEAGMNTVMFSAREDGFELDRFMLIKDKSENTRVCRAAGENSVNCSDGSIETLDGFVDAAVSLETDRTAGVEGDVFEFSAEVSNEDGFDEAEDVILTSQLNLGTDWELVTASDPCVAAGTELRCDLGDLEPTHPGEDEILSFSLRALTDGQKEVTALVSTGSNEEKPQNDTSSVTVAVERLIVYTTLASAISVDPVEPRVLDEIDVAITIENTGDSVAENTLVEVELPAEMIVATLPAECTSQEGLTCNVGNIQPGDSEVVTLQLTTDVEGMYPVSVQRSSDNMVDGSLSELFTIEVMSAEESIEPTEPTDPVEPVEPTEPEEEMVEQPTAPVDETDPSDSEERDRPQTTVDTLDTSGGAMHWLFVILLMASGLFRRTAR